jgi:hypothetical protein
MIEFWFKAWLILAVVFTVLYLITMLVAGPEITKTQSLISALIAGPIAAAVATALALVGHWIVVIEAH